MIIAIFRRNYGWGIGAFLVIALILLVGNKLEEIGNKFQYDTQWVDALPVAIEVGEQVELTVRTKDEAGVRICFLTKEDTYYYDILAVEYVKSRGRWNYYKVTVKGVIPLTAKNGCRLIAMSVTAKSPTLDHGMDWVKLYTPEQSD